MLVSPLSPCMGFRQPFDLNRQLRFSLVSPESPHNKLPIFFSIMPATAEEPEGEDHSKHQSRLESEIADLLRPQSTTPIQRHQAVRRSTRRTATPPASSQTRRSSSTPRHLARLNLESIRRHSSPSSPTEMDVRHPSPRRANSFRESTFPDQADVGLFAAALSGLENNSPSSDEFPMHEIPQEYHPTVSYNASHIPVLPNRQPDLPRHPQELSATPHLPSILPDTIAFQRRSDPPNQNAGMMPAIDLSAAMMGMYIGSNSYSGANSSPPDTPPEDDELPNYEESQRQAAEQNRRRAFGRAAELERRWASSHNYPY